jgi:hypothetical protein
MRHSWRLWKHGRLGCVLAELLGNIIVGEPLVCVVIMVMVVTDGRVSPIVYEVPRLECDTHGACGYVLSLRLFGVTQKSGSEEALIGVWVNLSAVGSSRQQ